MNDVNWLTLLGCVLAGGFLVTLVVFLLPLALKVNKEMAHGRENATKSLWVGEWFHDGVVEAMLTGKHNSPAIHCGPSYIVPYPEKLSHVDLLRDARSFKKIGSLYLEISNFYEEMEDMGVELAISDDLVYAVIEKAVAGEVFSRFTYDYINLEGGDRMMSIGLYVHPNHPEIRNLPETHIRYITMSIGPVVGEWCQH